MLSCRDDPEVPSGVPCASCVSLSLAWLRGLGLVTCALLLRTLVFLSAWLAGVGRVYFFFFHSLCLFHPLITLRKVLQLGSGYSVLVKHLTLGDSFLWAGSHQTDAVCLISSLCLFLLRLQRPIESSLTELIRLASSFLNTRTWCCRTLTPCGRFLGKLSLLVAPSQAARARQDGIRESTNHRHQPKTALHDTTDNTFFPSFPLSLCRRHQAPILLSPLLHRFHSPASYP